eukprot:maker-scaffold_42-snap-gene-0.52-mRNA-1 protein AED:0.00 eAED:0.00 QI:485/1/1/1/1/1/2/90/264
MEKYKERKRFEVNLPATIPKQKKDDRRESGDLRSRFGSSGSHSIYTQEFIKKKLDENLRRNYRVLRREKAGYKYDKRYEYNFGKNYSLPYHETTLPVFEYEEVTPYQQAEIVSMNKEIKSLKNEFDISTERDRSIELELGKKLGNKSKWLEAVNKQIAEDDDLSSLCSRSQTSEDQFQDNLSDVCSVDSDALYDLIDIKGKKANELLDDIRREKKQRKIKNFEGFDVSLEEILGKQKFSWKRVKSKRKKGKNFGVFAARRNLKA